MSPDWLNRGEEREGLFDGERRWLVDFDAALEKGMAFKLARLTSTLCAGDRRSLSI